MSTDEHLRCLFDVRGCACEVPDYRCIRLVLAAEEVS